MNIALIFAGGVGSRMGETELPKQFMKVDNIPILIHTLRIFQDCKEIDKIVVSVLKEYTSYTENMIKDYSLDKVIKVVEGGETGQLSIYNGLKAIENLIDAKNINPLILIHDGVRPNITKKLIKKNIETAIEYGNSITVAKATETFLVTKSLTSVKNVEQRDFSYIAKAPQCFHFNDILDTHEKALEKGIYNSIDSCTLMSEFGYKLSLTEGNIDNFKITTKSDYVMFDALKGGKHE